MAVVKKKVALKKKRKRWFKVLASDSLGNVPLGDLYAETADHLKGKQLDINMMSYTGNPKRQNTNLTFEVESIKGEQVFANLVGYTIPAPHIKRMSKRAKSKIDGSYMFKTKDGLSMRIKPMVLFKTRVPKSLMTDIRKKIKSFLKSSIGEYEFSKTIDSILKLGLQKNMKSELKKIYPIGSCIVRVAKKEK